ncbi:hypothetical protein KCV01_g58, partial [Aureobasidium melanogenum]
MTRFASRTSPQTLELFRPSFCDGFYGRTIGRRKLICLHLDCPFMPEPIPPSKPPRASDDTPPTSVPVNAPSPAPTPVPTPPPASNP